MNFPLRLLIRIIYVGAVLVFGAAVLQLWFDLSRERKEQILTLARGAEIYAEACATCHGEKLEGQRNWRTLNPDGRYPAPPHDETGHTWHHSDRMLLEITRLGSAAVIGSGYESDMPGFGETYSDEELRNVLEWIKTQWPEQERQYQAKVTKQEEALP